MFCSVKAGVGVGYVGQLVECWFWQVADAGWLLSADSFIVFIPLPRRIACINICEHVKNSKHWQPCYCLDTWKYSRHQANPKKWKVAAQVVRKLKMVTCAIHVLKNGCTATFKRGTQKKMCTGAVVSLLMFVIICSLAVFYKELYDDSFAESCKIFDFFQQGKWLLWFFFVNDWYFVYAFLNSCNSADHRKSLLIPL